MMPFAYNMTALLSTSCVCGVSLSVEQVLSCPHSCLSMKSMMILLHLLKEICHNVCIVPGLQPLNGRAIVDNGVCLDKYQFGGR